MKEDLELINSGLGILVMCLVGIITWVIQYYVNNNKEQLREIRKDLKQILELAMDFNVFKKESVLRYDNLNEKCDKCRDDMKEKFHEYSRKQLLTDENLKKLDEKSNEIVIKQKYTDEKIEKLQDQIDNINKK